PTAPLRQVREGTFGSRDLSGQSSRYRLSSCRHVSASPDQRRRAYTLPFFSSRRLAVRWATSPRLQTRDTLRGICAAFPWGRTRYGGSKPKTPPGTKPHGYAASTRHSAPKPFSVSRLPPRRVTTSRP